MDAPAIALYLGKLAAYEALAQFQGRNVCNDDVRPAYSTCARVIVFSLPDSVLTAIVAGTTPSMWDVEDEDFQREQHKYFGTRWDHADEKTKKAILAWYVISGEARTWIENIRGHVPASWDDVEW